MMWGDTAVINGGGAIKTNGTLWMWGENSRGGCWDGTTTSRNSPVQVGGLTDWATILAGHRDVPFAIKTNGTMWSGGNNSAGMQMHGGARTSSPVQIGSLTTWNANQVFGRMGESHSWGIK